MRDGGGDGCSSGDVALPGYSRTCSDVRGFLPLRNSGFVQALRISVVIAQ